MFYVGIGNIPAISETKDEMKGEFLNIKEEHFVVFIQSNNALR